MKALLAFAAASVIALAGAAAVAQPAPPAAQPPAAAPSDAAPPARPQVSRADMEALTDARIAGIQAGLKLNAEQQRLWAPVEQALRTEAAGRFARMEERRNQMEQRREARDRAARPDIMQMMERRAERASQEAQRLTVLTAAMKPFWASLDESQKRLLPRLMRDATGGAARWAAHERREMRHRHGSHGRH